MRCRRCSRRARFSAKDVFVTTKLWNNNHRPERVKPAFEASLPATAARPCRLLSHPYALRLPAGRRAGAEGRARPDHLRFRRDTGRRHGRRWRAWWTRASAGRSACRMSIWRNCRRSSKPRESSRRSSRSNPIRISRNGTCSTIVDEQGIVLLAFAALGHAMKPRLLDDPVIIAIARRLGKTPAQVVLAWAVQRGTALLTTSVKPEPHPGELRASRPCRKTPCRRSATGVATKIRFNSVVETGVPGSFPEIGERAAGWGLSA